jgi:hypothetical protein
MAALVAIMRRRLSGLALRRLWAGLWRTLAATAAMGAALALWLAATRGQPAWLVGLGGVAVGGAVFAAGAAVLRAPELALIRRRPLRATDDPSRR